MSKKDASLVKTCSNCGLQKPLSAFMQIAGPEGTTYGNICSSCRKTVMERAAKIPEPDESSSSTSGFKVDSKAKVRGDVDKKELRHKVEEQYHEERDKKAEQFIRVVQKGEKLEKEEKTRRESFLDKRPVSDKNKPGKEPQNIYVEQAAKEQQTDFTSPFIDTQIAKIKHTQSSTFNQFKAWLSKSSPIVQATEHAKRNQQNESKESDPLKYAEKTWGPKKR